jgi:hypothetical protein
LVKIGELSQAKIAAECGRKLSPTELAFYWYFTAIHIMEGAVMNPDVYRKWCEVLYEREREICTMFLEAVKKHDRAKIIEIADAVWFSGNHLKSDKCADNERRAIISIMSMIDIYGGKMSIQDLASLVGSITKKKITDQGDGYSALRRKCKEIGFPLAKSRRGRRKKGK